MARINNGFVILSRQIFNSEVITWTPLHFKLWIWLILKAQHTDTKVSGSIIHRGSLLTAYDELAEVGKWIKGWKHEKPTKNQIAHFIKKLKKADMITTRKTTRGIIIKIVNYDYYQTAGNYEHNKDTNTDHNESDHKQDKSKKQNSSTINKNVKTAKNAENKNISGSSPEFKRNSSLPVRKNDGFTAVGDIINGKDTDKV